MQCSKTQCTTFVASSGVGGNETASLFKRLRACEDGLFFQPFWTQETHDGGSLEQIAAVAARFDMVPRM